MHGIAYRAAAERDAEPVAELVRVTFAPDTLPGWTEAAVANFLEQNTPEALRTRFADSAFAHVCVGEGTVVGYISCKSPGMLSLLVVRPSFQGLGVGSQLLDYALQHIAATAPDVSVVEVNATEHSVPFYRRRGFYPISEFIEHRGCRFVRMAFWRKSPVLARSC